MFEQQVIALHVARQEVQQLQKEVDDSYEEWRLVNGDAIARHEQAKSDLKEVEADLRIDIVADYVETGNKKPHPKLGVRVSMVPTYDNLEMTEYAKTCAIALLVLDTTKTNRYLKALAGPKGILGGRLGELVTFGEKVTATISKDLRDG